MTSLSDLDLVALTVYGEARGEPVEGKIAVGNVIRNRLQTNRWGSTYKRVVLAPMQFSCWTPAGGASNYTMLKALAQQVMNGHPPGDPVLAECYWIAAGMQSGACQDNTAQATHYFATQTKMPKWAIGQVPVRVIGAHSFFAGIA